MISNAPSIAFKNSLIVSNCSGLQSVFDGHVVGPPAAEISGKNSTKAKAIQ